MRAPSSLLKLLTDALIFKETVTPIKAAFVALGSPAGVDVELGDLITSLQGEGTRKIAGVDTQVNGTFAIKAKVREGIQHMRDLDAIFTQLYRKVPVLLAEWKAANRAMPYSTTEATVDTGSGSGTEDSAGGSGGTVAVTA